MLVVLSEINCLNNIKAKGIYPDEFYTSINTFKSNSIYFKEATIIVIFAGNCHFNKKHTIELIKNLYKRAESTTDKGVEHVYVISDMTIAGLRSYYKYEGSIDTVDIMHGWNNVKQNVNIWVKLQNEPRETKCFLSSFDQGKADEAKARYENRHKSEDDYVPLIQVANIKDLLAVR